MVAGRAPEGLDWVDRAIENAALISSQDLLEALVTRGAILLQLSRTTECEVVLRGAIVVADRAGLASAGLRARNNLSGLDRGHEPRGRHRPRARDVRTARRFGLTTWILQAIGVGQPAAVRAGPMGRVARAEHSRAAGRGCGLLRRPGSRAASPTASRTAAPPTRRSASSGVRWSPNRSATVRRHRPDSPASWATCSWRAAMAGSVRRDARRLESQRHGAVRDDERDPGRDRGGRPARLDEARPATSEQSKERTCRIGGEAQTTPPWQRCSKAAGTPRGSLM